MRYLFNITEIFLFGGKMKLALTAAAGLNTVPSSLGEGSNL